MLISYEGRYKKQNSDKVDTEKEHLWEDREEWTTIWVEMSMVV
jgi:hypothetical protein